MPAGTVAPGIVPQYATQPDAQPVSFSDAPVGSHQSAPAKEHAAAGAPNGEEFTSCLDAGGDAWIGDRLVMELCSPDPRLARRTNTSYIKID